jgi:phage gpG-like protein
MAGAFITINGGQELQRFLDKLPEGIYGAAKTSFARAAVAAHAKITSRIQNGTPMYRRSGNLARSMNFSVSGDTLGSLNASVFSSSTVQGSPVIYAPIHETGGTVKAKNAYARVPGGPYLNIPTSANKTASGVQRLSAREVFANGGKVIKSKKGNYLVFGKTARGFEPMFVLKKSVSIPARLQMRETVLGEVPGLISSLDDLLQKALRDG